MLTLEAPHTEATTSHSTHTSPHPYSAHLSAFQQSAPSTPIALPASCRKITTALVHPEWVSALQDHPDQTFAAYISEGIKGGFRIGYLHNMHAHESAHINSTSAHANPGPIRDNLATELSAGRVVPLPAWFSMQVHTSPFTVIPKPHQSGALRLIQNRSKPVGVSVNDGIPQELCTLQYPTIDTAVTMVLAHGTGARLAKIDIKHAFRNIPVHPDDRPLLGMTWEGRTLIYTVLPFGLRSAPQIFSAVADALEWIAIHEGLSALIHYMDDFLTVGAPGSDECQRNLDTILRICDRLGNSPQAPEDRRTGSHSGVPGDPAGHPEPGDPPPPGEAGPPP